MPNIANIIADYDRQLNRFYPNSMALEVLFCLIMISLLIIEIIKFYKKTYEWANQQEIKLQRKYTDQTNEVRPIKNDSSVLGNQIKLKTKQSQRVEGFELPKIREGLRRELLPGVLRMQNMIKRRVCQVVIIGVNVLMVGSFEFCTIMGYIVVVLIVISELISKEHLRLKLGLQIISKLLIVAIYINLYTVAKPSNNA